MSTLDPHNALSRRDLEDAKKELDIRLVEQDVRLVKQMERVWGRDEDPFPGDSRHRKRRLAAAKGALKIRLFLAILFTSSVGTGIIVAFLALYFDKEGNVIAARSEHGTFLQRRHDFIVTLQDNVRNKPCEIKNNALTSLLMLLDYETGQDDFAEMASSYSGWRFTGCPMQSIQFPQDSTYTNLHFEDASLTDVSFSNSTLQSPVFRNATAIARVRFENTTIVDGDFNNANLSGAHFSNVTFAGNVDFDERARFGGTTICSVDFSGALNLRQSHLAAMRPAPDCPSKSNWGITLPTARVSERDRKPLTIPAEWRQQSR